MYIASKLTRVLCQSFLESIVFAEKCREEAEAQLDTIGQLQINATVRPLQGHFCGTAARRCFVGLAGNKGPAWCLPEFAVRQWVMLLLCNVAMLTSALPAVCTVRQWGGHDGHEVH